MRNLEISLMRDADVAFAVEMTDAENWGNVAADFRRLIAIEPEGCFVAHHRGRPVGMITTTTYGEFGFVGSLIVRPKLRRQGVGQSLIEHAVDYLDQKGVTTQELDGVFAAVSLYRRLGFRDKYLSLRFRGHAPAVNPQTVPAHSPDRKQILTLDRELTGLDRATVIDRLLDAYGESSFLSRNRKLEGYAIVREQAAGRLSCGPFVAATAATAEELLRSMFRRYAGREIRFGVPDANRQMVGLLGSYAFEHLEPSLRMYRGRHITYEHHIYAIMSPEKG